MPPSYRTPIRLALALILALGATLPVRAQAPAVARINGADVPASALSEADEAHLLALEEAFQSDMAAERLRYDRERDGIAEQALNALVLDRLTTLEAKARHTTVEAVRASAKPVPVTDADLHAYYDRERAALGVTFEVASPEIRKLLEGEAKETADWELQQSLRRKYGARLLREPLRAAVPATGPSRGPADARITIIEFADFQCPFCARANTVLSALLKAYPRDVRLVFRHLPLSDLHPNAVMAAAAGVCADEQGKFWAMHDAMFADPSRLDPESLHSTALGLGLDQARFDSCFTEQRPRPILDAELKAAKQWAIDGTPGLFLNGRFVSGARSFGYWKALVEDELARLAP